MTYRTSIKILVKGRATRKETLIFLLEESSVGHARHLRHISMGFYNFTVEMASGSRLEQEKLALLVGSAEGKSYLILHTSVSQQ